MPCGSSWLQMSFLRVRSGGGGGVMWTVSRRHWRVGKPGRAISSVYSHILSAHPRKTSEVYVLEKHTVKVVLFNISAAVTTARLSGLAELCGKLSSGFEFM